MNVPGSPARRRGPKPLLSAGLESHLVQWVLAQQSSGRRVSRDDVITQTHEMLRKDEILRKEDTQEEIKAVGMGWCNRFVSRHPELNLRYGGIYTGKKQKPGNYEEISKFTLRDDSVATNVQSTGNFKASNVKNQMEKHEQEAEEVGEVVGQVKTRKYNQKHMEAAVEMYLAGRPMSDVTQRFPLLHQRTIRRRVLRVQRGESDRRRGPRPLLEVVPEQELVAWLLDLQSRGIHVTKHEILARANEKYRMLNGGEEEGEKLKEGWLRRFKERHPILSGRAPGTNQEWIEEKVVGNSAPNDELIPAIAEDSAEKRFGPAGSTHQDIVTPKRRRTEAQAAVSSRPHRASILLERQQIEKDENVRKLDVIKQSTQRLEEMQQHQLEMLKQLCASNKVLSISTGNKQNSESSSTE